MKKCRNRIRSFEKKNPNYFWDPKPVRVLRSRNTANGLEYLIEFEDMLEIYILHDDYAKYQPIGNLISIFDGKKVSYFILIRLPF